MKRSDIYDAVVEPFNKKYNFLGRQFAEELLLSAASWNIQQISKPDFRIRRHLMLFWQPGWVKTSLLLKAYDLFGPDLAIKLSDITVAALRGTVEFGRFVSPYTLKRPFSICTEFGQVISGAKDEELVQKLLNVLEEGSVNVSLGKISSLSRAERERVEAEFPVQFIDNNTFHYTTNWVLLAGTYNKKFLVDSALESRFNFLIPEKKLDSGFTKFLVNSGRYEMSEEVAKSFRSEIVSKKEMVTNIKLPEEIYTEDTNFSPRDSGMIISHVLCKAFWGKKLSKDDILDLAKNIRDAREKIWKSAEDKVFDCVFTTAKFPNQIAEETGLTERQVYYSIKKLRNIIEKIHNEDFTRVKYVVKRP